MYFNGIETGKIMLKVLQKREKRARRKHKKENNQPKGEKKEENGKTDDVYKNVAKNNTPIRNFPENLLVKCLMSQPVDILCQAALTSFKIINEIKMNSLSDVFVMLSKERLERLKAFARLVIKEELDRLKEDYDPTAKIRVRPKNKVSK